MEHLGIAVESLENSDRLFERLLGKPNYKQESVEREGAVSYTHLDVYKRQTECHHKC